MDASLVLSFVLVVVTSIYSWLTWRISRVSGIAAEAARDSAEAARAAADASYRSAVIAEAQLTVDFEVVIDRHADGNVWFRVTPSVNLVLYPVSGDLYVVVQDDPFRVQTCPAVTLRNPGHVTDWDFPKFMHAAETYSLEWVNPVMRKTDHAVFGTLDFEYSLSDDAPHRTRSVYVESTPDLQKKLMTYLNMPTSQHNAKE